MVRIREAIRRVLSDDRRRRLRWLLGRIARSYIVIIIVGIVIGLQVAPVVSDVVEEPVTGTVAVIPLQGGINGQSATEVAAMLQQARNDPSIKAVVLRVNSPGGSASASGLIYMEVKKTAEEMPVVSSVNTMAASGAYYAMASTDQIYVKPESLVGSIGVIFVAPTSIGPVEQIITSGPSKLSGADRKEWDYKTEAVKRAFVGAVMTGRGDRLNVPRSEITQAKLYTGGEAVQNGLADEVGGADDAIKRAASMAGLTGYDVKIMRPDGTVQYITRSTYVSANVSDKELVSPTYFVGTGEATDAPHFLMLPRSIVYSALQHRATDQTEVTANGTATVEP